MLHDRTCITGGMDALVILQQHHKMLRCGKARVPTCNGEPDKQDVTRQGILGFEAE